MSTRPKRKPRRIAAPAIVQRAARFATVKGVLDRLERGEYDVIVRDGQDVPIYRDLVTGGTYELIPALEGWCLFIGKMRDALPLEAHRRVIEALRAGGDLQQTDLDAMRAEIVQHEAVYLTTTAEQRASIARTCQIVLNLGEGNADKTGV